MTKVRVGIRIPSVMAPALADLRAFVLEAEALGFDSIWAGDHVFHHTDVQSPLELLSWVAALTTRARLGTSVTLASYLNPVLLAKYAATLDWLSEGRLTLGVSIGGSEAEFNSLGVPTKERVGRLRESIALMRRLWREDDVEHAGRYFTVEGGNVRPKPCQTGRVPILLAARGPKMLQRVPLIADGWVASSHETIPSFIACIEELRSYDAEAGLAPGTSLVAKVHDISVNADRAEARRSAAKHWQNYYGPAHDVDVSTTYGTPAECAAELAAFKDTAAPEMTLILEPSSLSLEELRLVTEVARTLS